jgi:hypothetical protein
MIVPRFMSSLTACGRPLQRATDCSSLSRAIDMTDSDKCFPLDALARQGSSVGGKVIGWAWLTSLLSAVRT